MKGRYTVIVSNRKVQFTLNVERNITVICGESATGKTTLVGLIQNFESYGSKSGVSVRCEKPCRVLNGVDWQVRLENIHESIVFIDEGNEFLKSKEFARAVNGNDNYFVLITRESLYQLPYSVNSVLKLRTTTSRNKRTYNRAYPYYDTVKHVSDELERTRYIVTEDGKSGYQMFAQIASMFSVTCISANGKSNLFDLVESLGSEKILVVADGAAFGAEMNKISKLINRAEYKALLYLPESFEWLILISGIVSGRQLKKILEDPVLYIESEQYISWERYFTALLTELTRNTPLQYNKATLPSGYLQQENVKKVIDAIENGK
jgi:hypothetical protein